MCRSTPPSFQPSSLSFYVCLSRVITRLKHAHTYNFTATATTAMTTPTTRATTMERHCIDNVRSNPQPRCVPKCAPIEIDNPFAMCSWKNVLTLSKDCNGLLFSTLSARHAHHGLPSHPPALNVVVSLSPSIGCSHFLPVAKLATYIVYIVNECDTFNL